MKCEILKKASFSLFSFKKNWRNLTLTGRSNDVRVLALETILFPRKKEKNLFEVKKTVSNCNVFTDRVKLF